MEETNPWLDPECGKHNNKKSARPVKKFEKVEVKLSSSIVLQGELKPVEVKPDNREFIETLVQDSLDSDLPKTVQDWAIENFDKEYLDGFLQDIEAFKADIITKNNPTHREIFLLKYVFLLRRGF